MYSPPLAIGQDLKGIQSLYQLYHFFPSLIYFPSAPVSLYTYSYPTCVCLSKLPQTPKEDFSSGLLDVGSRLHGDHRILAHVSGVSESSENCPEGQKWSQKQDGHYPLSAVE